MHPQDSKPNLPQLVIVLGPPAAGKSTLARRLAAQFSLPLLSKDDIKERLFDTLGWEDPVRAQRFGQASTAILLRFAEAQITARRACLIESNFAAAQVNSVFAHLQQRAPFSALQILCHAEYSTLIQRLLRRADAGERHPGHYDYLRVADFTPAYFQAQSEPLPLTGQLIEVDTTDLAALDSPALWAHIQQLIRAEPY